MTLIPKSLFRNMVVWHVLSVTVVVAVYTWILYYEIERGRRQPFDVRLDHRAERIASLLHDDNGSVDVTYLPVADLSNGWFAVYDAAWRLKLASLDWNTIRWSTNVLDMAHLAARTAAGKKYHCALADAAGNEMRMVVIQALLEPLPAELHAAPPGAARPTVFIACADLYEPVSQFLSRQIYRMIAALSLVLVVILVSGIAVARMSVRPVKRLAYAAKRIMPEDTKTRLPVNELPDELRVLATRLNEAFTRLDAALASERNFTASAAHELRSPVAGIAGRLDVLRHHESLPLDLHEQVDLVYADAERLSRLSGQLLLLSRLDRAAAGDPFKTAPVDLAEVSRDAIDAWAPRAAERRVTIRFASHGDTVIEGHEEWLLRAVYNLVSNAVKFTADGTNVAVRLEPTADNLRMMLSVTDAGPGILAEERTRIFERFYRSTRTSSIEGSGFGLAIVHDVVRAHRGEVFISPGPDHTGANVTIILPRCRS